MTKHARILVALAAAALGTLYAFPLWRINLIAPQYPEGLGMLISIDDVRGIKEQDIANINGLNHYIGMKTIDPAGIPELQFFPWVVAGLIAGALLVALWGNRRALYVYTVLFAGLAAAGLWDFWRWTYDYGHNLDMEAAIIKVPGAVYQPPILGTKQILNFTASSWPALGGIMAFAAFGLVALAVLLTLRERRRVPRTTEHAAAFRAQTVSG